MAVAAVRRLLPHKQSNAARAARADVRAAIDENAAAAARLERATDQAQAASERTVAALVRRYGRAVRDGAGRMIRKNGPGR